MLSISIDLENFEEIYNLTQYKNVWCTTGVHQIMFQRNQILKYYKSHLLKNLLKKKKVVKLVTDWIITEV